MSDNLIRLSGEPTTTGRNIFGIVVPYGEVARVRDAGGQAYDEQFEFGAFRRSIAERGHKVKLWIGHDGKRLPVGKATQLREERDGLHASFEIANTREGDDILTLVRDGYAEAFSIGFAPIRQRLNSDGVLIRVEAALREISLVAQPAYAGAVIQGVRSQFTEPIISAESMRIRLSAITHRL